MSFFFSFLSLGHGIGDGVFNRISTWRGGMQGKAGRSTYLLFISGGLSALRCSVFLVYLLYFLARVWHRLAYLHCTLPLLYSTWAVFCSFLLSFQHALRLISESDCGFVRIPSHLSYLHASFIVHVHGAVPSLRALTHQVMRAVALPITSCLPRLISHSEIFHFGYQKMMLQGTISRDRTIRWVTRRSRSAGTMS